MRNVEQKASRSRKLAAVATVLMFSLTVVPCMRLGHAQIQAVSYWLFNPVTLDGAITSPSEWAESVGYDMSLDRRWGWPDPQVEPSNKSLKAWFKNDEVWLYMLYQIPWPVAEADTARDWGLILQGGSDSGWVKFQTTFDGYGFNGTEWSSDVEGGGQNNVEGAVSYDNMFYWFEFRKMLDSGDGLDWSLSPGESVDGLRVGVYDDSIESIYTQDVSLQLALRPPTTVYSSWLTSAVELDGKITTDMEWSDTTPVDVTLYEPTGGTVAARLWMKNDDTWLYELFKVEWPADTTIKPGGYSDAADLCAFWDWKGPPPPLWSHSDAAFVHYDNTSWDMFGWDGTYFYNDVTEGSPPGENNVEGVATHDGTCYWFEFRKELDSGDGYDWSWTPGEIIGPLQGTSLLVGLYDSRYPDPSVFYYESIELHLSIGVTVGTNVTVFPTKNLALTFANVTVGGAVVANETPTVHAPPLNNTVGQYYDVNVAAGFSGNVTVSLVYDDSNMTQQQESNLQMMEYTPIPGDILDYGRVNILDIASMAKCFGTTPISWIWNPAADMNGDRKIDILDISRCAKNFGKTAEWTNITAYVDTELNIVHGETTHFSFIGIH